ncbi:ankyrin repeat domain-containing protein SOWAHB-like isoform X2 [Episyrphus balteatus]|uniref:ankyrin repeat domain-containing protein SOWAHB-like isoform X2 n=1 Tax=Episyrphus balteatus TaxID=286459 RepID=UPI00248685CF|nr:ankyrin repeat domain-containing protein SOWAHB-like isoform X2 [Episyrphus balteatus]
MESPKELSLVEIRKYMLANGCKVTNHALVKHFKKFLTNPDTQSEARKQFKTYVNILSTIKNENDQKYLILRKKYLHECPTEEMALRTEVVPSSPGAMSLVSEGLASPFRQPPPYKPPPEVSSPLAAKLPVLQPESADNYRDCINEFAAAVRLIDSASRPREESPPAEKEETVDDDVKMKIAESEKVPAAKVRRENSIESENKENVVRSSISSSDTFSSLENSEKTSSDAENPISVKEATRKFNRMASEEEAKIISPPTKKKPEKVIEEKMTPEVTLSHPKGKEWVVSSAKANYQELAKLASEYPELVKLQV